jgi:hypothetical protein
VWEVVACAGRRRKECFENPNSPRIEVEDAMALTLQKNHIDLPDS